MSLQASIEDVAAGFRRALKRKHYETDIESQVALRTNRGYKDLYGAHGVQLGRLAQSSVLPREVVELGGLRREIISYNPQLVDLDGYTVDYGDDEEQVQEATTAAAQFYPYSNIHLEELLAPLTAITQLPTHPTLSRPFTSNILAQLVDQTSEMTRKEKQSLWKTKGLYTQLCGDYDWVPCGLMVPEHTPSSDCTAKRPRKPTQPDSIKVNGMTNGHRASSRLPNGTGDVDMTDADTTNAVDEDDAEMLRPNGVYDAFTDGDDADDMTAAGNGQPSMPSDTHELERSLDPLFYPPPRRPDRNIGLPEDEAETMRKLLMLWVQKQEEVCRGMTKLNNGLLRADRLRLEVLQWAKAEAHYGPNRDIPEGEDWYDKERWGLDEELKKGDDEVEEEDTGAAAKKTRARRG